MKHLSPESRYLRFHGTVTDLSKAQWEYLGSADGSNHVAVGAWIGRTLVGVGRYIRLAHQPGTAEVAFAVADDLQRRGLGSLLRDELVATASRSGIRSFRAEVMAGNQGMRRLLRTPSLSVVSDVGGAIEARLVNQDARPESLTA